VPNAIPILLVSANPNAEAATAAVLAAEGMHAQIQSLADPSPLKFRNPLPAFDAAIVDEASLPVPAAEVVRSLRALFPFTPVLVVTRRSDPSAIVAAVKAGAFDVVENHDHVAVARAVRRALGQSSAIPLNGHGPTLDPLAAGLLDSVDAAVAWLAPDGKTLHANRAWNDLARRCETCPSATCSQTSWIPVCVNSEHPGAPDAPTLDRGVTSALLGESTGFSTDYPCVAGMETRWFRLRALPLTGGPARGAILVQTDVTESKNGEIALRESEFRLAALVNSAMDGIITVDAAGFITFINPAAVSMFGYSAEEAKTLHIDLLLPPAVMGDDPLLSLTDERHHTGFRTELRAAKKSGQRFPVEASITRSLVNGRARFTLVLRDLTAGRRQERAITEKQNLLSAVAEGLTSLFALKDRHGHYLHINAPGARMFGRTAREIVGRTDDDLHPKETALAIRAKDKAIMGGGATETFRETLWIDGRNRTLLTTKGPWRDADGSVIGLFVIARDISGIHFTPPAP
jgi:PAS domain S-box-containing protein